MNKAPDKRIPWSRDHSAVLSDKHLMTSWIDKVVSDEFLAKTLRKEYGLQDFTDEEIIQNVNWLGYYKY